MEVENKKNSISFVNGLNDTDPQPSEGSVFNVMFQQYDRVVVESLITSFGLDMLLVKDQYGGDVDTVHNVRKIGYDSNMGYKNPENEKIYRERGLYDEASYHSGGAFRIKKHEARERMTSSSYQRNLYNDTDAWALIESVLPQNDREVLNQVKTDFEWFQGNYAPTYVDKKKGPQPGYYRESPRDNASVIKNYEGYLRRKRDPNPKASWIAPIYSKVNIEQILSVLKAVYR